MAIQVIVFDFDGTLVESNQLKYEAFFDLFPRDEQHISVIRQVLSVHREESRYVILEKILKLVEQDADDRREKIARLADRYNQIVLDGAKTCPEIPDAERVLQQLHARFALYVSSTTPEVALCEIINFRGWSGYFRETFGYPRKKSETLRDIMRREQAQPQQILVVGDGESDKMSARETGCEFFSVKETTLTAIQLY